MQWSDISFAPSRRTLRQFAGLWLAFFGSMAVWQSAVRDRPTVAALLGSVAVVGGVAGLAWPPAIRWVYVGWMVAVFPVGWVVSWLVLGVMYYAVITPVALVFRLVGRDALQLRPPAEADTCWEAKPVAEDAGRYLRQY